MIFGDYRVKSTGSASFGLNQNVKNTDEKIKEPILSVKKEEKDLDKLPQGYSIEKTFVDTDDDTDTDETIVDTDDDTDKTSADTDDDTDVVETNNDAADENTDNDNTEEEVIDHNINTEDRIHTHKSIAKHKSDNAQINSAMGTVTSAFFDDLKDDDSYGAEFINAYKSTEDKDTDFLKDIPNGTHYYGKVIGEFSRLTDNSEAFSVDINSKSYQGSFGMAYGKQYKGGQELKIMGHGFVNKTHDNGKVTINNLSQYIPDDIDEDLDDDLSKKRYMQQEEEISDDSTIPYDEKTVDYKALIAAKYKFANKDDLSGSLSYFNDGSEDARADGTFRYENNKYNIYGQINGTYYFNRQNEYNQSGDTERTLVTNLKFGFMEPSEDENTNSQQNNEQQTVEDNNEVTVPEINTKKWTKYSHPYVISNIVGESYENGLGLDQIFKKTASDSNLRVAAFGQYSFYIEPKDEEHLQYTHNITFGGDIDYLKHFRNGTLNVNAKIRDKYMFGEGNSFTAKAKASYTTNKLDVGAEAMYIKVPTSSYFGASANVSYSPKNWLTLFGSAYVINLKQTDESLNAVSAQVGVRAYF